MIRDVATNLRTRLVEKQCPIQTVLLEETTDTTTGARERIVVTRDKDAGDTFEAIRGTRDNPKRVITRTVAFKVTAYIQSAKSGAMAFEHEERADRLVETVLACLDRVMREDLQVFWAPTGGAFVSAPDLAPSAKPPGLVYELRFTADRAVRDVTWEGAARPEVDITDGFFVNRTDVGLANGPDGAPVVTGCGG